MVMLEISAAAFVRLTGLPKSPTGGDIVEFGRISGQAYYVVSVSGYNSGQRNG